MNVRRGPRRSSGAAAPAALHGRLTRSDAGCRPDPGPAAGRTASAASSGDGSDDPGTAGGSSRRAGGSGAAGDPTLILAIRRESIEATVRVRPSTVTVSPSTGSRPSRAIRKPAAVL